jgi:hypothetical protein
VYAAVPSCRVNSCMIVSLTALLCFTSVGSDAVPGGLSLLAGSEDRVVVRVCSLDYASVFSPRL